MHVVECNIRGREQRGSGQHILKHADYVMSEEIRFRIPLHFPSSTITNNENFSNQLHEASLDPYEILTIKFRKLKVRKPCVYNRQNPFQINLDTILIIGSDTSKQLPNARESISDKLLQIGSPAFKKFLLFRIELIHSGASVCRYKYSVRAQNFLC